MLVLARSFSLLSKVLSHMNLVLKYIGLSVQGERNKGQKTKGVWLERPHLRSSVREKTKKGHFGVLLRQHVTSSVAHPNVEAHNFELKSALISMVQQSPLGGSPMEDPNL